MDINKIKLNKKFKLVEASAGTGKSFTLAHIVLRNVLENKIQPDQILLLSFTKNTCSELREKIVSRFKKLKLFIQNKDESEIDTNLLEWFYQFQNSGKYSEKIVSEIDDFVNNIYKLKVLTFHGFCNHILEEYNIDIGFEQNPQIENNLDYLYQDIVNDLWIDQFLNLDPVLISTISQKRISSVFGSKINKSFFVKFLKAIDQENICKLQINNKYQSINISNYLKEFLYINWKQFWKEWNDKGEDLFLQLVELGKKIKESGGKSQIYSPNPRNKFNQVNEWVQETNQKINLENINQYIQHISDEDILFKYFYKNINKEIRKFNIDLDLHRYKSILNKIYGIKEGFFTEFVRVFIQLAYLKLITQKRRLSIVNFNDLIKIIENKYLLSDISNDRSFYEIQKTYKCILVDEFQDTDNIQWNIIKKFFNTNNHFLFCVGDPKQAIYKFRGGDIQTYLAAKSNASEVFNLLNNYRSSNQLLDIINRLFENGFKESKLEYKKLNSRINNDKYYRFDSKQIFEIIEFSNKESDLEVIVTKYLVNFLLKNKEIDINKISILTLYNYQCIELKNKLINFNIPCKIQNKQNVFDTEASSLLVFFIDSLLNPWFYRNTRLLATSKFVEIDLGELVEDQISKKLELLNKRCVKWSLELKEKGFLTLVNELIASYKSSSIIYDVDLYTNLFQLSEILEIELINNDFNLNKVYKWYQNQLDDNSRTCIGEDYLTKNYGLKKGVNISTIHNSKGLEYDIVLCPYLSFISRKSNETKGPFWKLTLSRTIYINISNVYSEVEELKLIEEKDLFKECERLIYVALTRSKYKLVIFNDIDKKNNILNNDLLSNLENINSYKVIIKNNLNTFDCKDFLNRFNKDKLNNNLWKINKINTKKTKNLLSDEEISFSSYSSWTRKDDKADNKLNQYKDYEDNISIIKTLDQSINENKKNISEYLTFPNPLSDFPKGIVAGTCLHKILERFDFKNYNSEELLNLISEELRFHQIDTSLAYKVREAILRIINIPIGGKLENRRLVDIPNQNILKEVKYDLTLSYKGRSINTYDISQCFLLDQKYEFGEEYSRKINDLQIHNKGFHSGCIDCVIPIGNTIEDSKWWLIDWKSNFISGSDNSSCLPKNYNYKNMKEEMIKHHYPLQSHLYLLALHRLLKWRVKNYQPKLHLGGYIYLFLKGLPDIKSFEKFKTNDISPGIFIGQAPLNRINYLDNLFSNEE